MKIQNPYARKKAVIARGSPNVKPTVELRRPAESAKPVTPDKKAQLKRATPTARKELPKRVTPTTDKERSKTLALSTSKELPKKTTPVTSSEKGPSHVASKSKTAGKHLVLPRKNKPSLRMKLKKEIEELKRQQQRQKERLEAEMQRKKLEKQQKLERRKAEANRQSVISSQQQRQQQTIPAASSLNPQPVTQNPTAVLAQNVDRAKLPQRGVLAPSTHPRNHPPEVDAHKAVAPSPMRKFPVDPSRAHLQRVAMPESSAGLQQPVVGPATTTYHASSHQSVALGALRHCPAVAVAPAEALPTRQDSTIIAAPVETAPTLATTPALPNVQNLTTIAASVKTAPTLATTPAFPNVQNLTTIAASVETAPTLATAHGVAAEISHPGPPEPSALPISQPQPEDTTSNTVAPAPVSPESRRTQQEVSGSVPSPIQDCSDMHTGRCPTSASQRPSCCLGNVTTDQQYSGQTVGGCGLKGNGINTASIVAGFQHPNLQMLQTSNVNLALAGANAPNYLGPVSSLSAAPVQQNSMTWLGNSTVPNHGLQQAYFPNNHQATWQSMQQPMHSQPYSWLNNYMHNPVLTNHSTSNMVGHVAQATNPFNMQWPSYPPQFQPIASMPNTLPFYMNNPWSMTMTAASMGQALPQANTVRRSVNRSTAKRTSTSHSTKTEDIRIISTPCREPSPFAATHEVFSHKIIMIKAADGKEGFGVTVKRELQSSLVGTEEWPYLEMIGPKRPAPAATVTTGKPEADSAIAAKPLDKTEAPSSASAPVLPKASVPAGPKSEPDAVETNNKPETNINNSRVVNNDDVPPVSGTDTTQQGSKDRLVSMDTKQESTSAGTSVPPSKIVTQGPPTKVRRKRRRRLTFCTLQVLNPTKQNSRQDHPAKTKSMELEEGDIILSIQGQSTSGKTFEDAVKLFALAKEVDEHGYILCTITIARRKKKAAPAPVVPVDKPMIQAVPQFSKLPLVEEELVALARTMLSMVKDPIRTLGQALSTFVTESNLRRNSLFASRSIEFLQSCWQSMASTSQRDMRKRAAEHWALEWQKEPETIRSHAKGPLSDAQRSTRRARPRPAKGCRCGSPDHEYVNDPNCPLYSNLRRLSESKDELPSVPSRPKVKAPRDLNVMEKAYKERFLRMKEDQVALEAEAAFVDQMESIQIEKCGKAVFAPGSLAAMIISAVVELAPSFSGRKHRPRPNDNKTEEEPKPKENVDDGDEVDDDDDDDDIPLLCLGKRNRSSSPVESIKKLRRETEVPLDYLAALVKYVCHRWGHVYRESTDSDYAWRWEVYHGQATTSFQTSECKNPRKAGSLSLEHIPFLVNDPLIQTMQQAELSGATPPCAALHALAQVLVPSRTGILDEFLALVRTSVLELNEAGIPRLTSNWYSHVDILLLDDMDAYWGIRPDPSGKFGVSPEVRTVLSQEWERTDIGWVLVNDDPYDVVYEFAVFDEWRDAFEDKEQTKADTVEGVGRFGI